MEGGAPAAPRISKEAHERAAATKAELERMMAERALADQALWLGAAPLMRPYLGEAAISGMASPVPPPTPSNALTVGATSESV